MNTIGSSFELNQKLRITNIEISNIALAYAVI